MCTRLPLMMEVGCVVLECGIMVFGLFAKLTLRRCWGCALLPSQLRRVGRADKVVERRFAKERGPLTRPWESCANHLCQNHCPTMFVLVFHHGYPRTLVAAVGALVVLASSMDTGNGSHHQTCEAGFTLYSYSLRAMKPEGRKK